MPEKKIILIGGGGHCRSCIDVIEENGSFRIVGIVEQPGRIGKKSILEYPIIGNDCELSSFKKLYDYALVTVGQTGSSSIRQNIFSNLKKSGFILPVIISPLAHVSKHATIGEGTIVMHQTVVNAGTQIGKNCILNTKSLVEHDAKVGNHTHISTSVVINGNVSIGSGCFVGSNAIIVHGVKLPDDYFFKAGVLITSKNNGEAIKGKIS